MADDDVNIQNDMDGIRMIKYDRLWETMKKRGISQYALYTYYGIDRSLLDRFRKNKNIEIYTLDKICTILDCKIEDIVEHLPDVPEDEERPPTT